MHRKINDLKKLNKFNPHENCKFYTNSRVPSIAKEKPYYLEGTFREKALVQSNVLKNYYHEKKVEALELKRKKDKFSCFYEENEKKPVVVKSGQDESFYTLGNKTSKNLGKRNILYDKVTNNLNLDENSFDNFSFGFATKNITNPSLSQANKHIKEKLKLK